MPTLTQEMKDAVTAARLAYVATVSPDGAPNLSPKGSLQPWDDDHLVFADLASPMTIRNLRANPRIEINVVDPFARRGFRFRGRADVLADGPVFAAVAAALLAKFGPKLRVDHVVRVRVEEARPVISPAYALDPSATVESVTGEWLDIYGVSVQTKGA